MRKPLILIMLLVCTRLLGQTQYSQEVDSYLQLGKDSLINLAISNINEGLRISADILTQDNYPNIEILTDGHDILVYFESRLVFVPKDSCMYSAVGSYLIKGGITLEWPSLVDQGYCDEELLPYYKTTSETNSQIDVVASSILSSTKSNSIGDIRELKSEVIIYEKKDTFLVYIFDDDYTTKVTIKKKSHVVSWVKKKENQSLPDLNPKRSAYKPIDLKN